MRWRYFILLQIILILIVSALVYKHQSKIALVKVPPTELAQWYKPENKRQVWLHNMFKLRREMQAVALYAKQKDDDNLIKWTELLGKHYLKIAEMTPSWQKKLDTKTMQALNKASAEKNYSQVNLHLDKLQQSCNGCHDDYQAITALTYRTPDFSVIEMNDNTPFNEHMKTLTQQVNQIKISAQDGYTELALSSLNELNASMNDLGDTCVNCHKKGNKPYPSELMTKTLASLKKALVSGTAKDKGRELGTLAVLACARCHGTHRIAYGAKKQLTKKISLTELLKH